MITWSGFGKGSHPNTLKKFEYGNTQSNMRYLKGYLHTITININFFPDGKLQAKGIALNSPDINDRVRIGKWIEFDEKRGKYKQVNYDKKRGKIGFRELLQIVENDKNDREIINYYLIDYLYDSEKKFGI